MAEKQKRNILEKLVGAGVHYGHKTSSCEPAFMQQYAWGTKNGIALINVGTTAVLLERAEKFLESVAAQGKTILWVGTKKSAQEAIRNAGMSLKNPFVDHRWIGGTFTNKDQVKKLVTKMLHYEDILKKSSELHYTKKELSSMNKLLAKFQKNVGGIRTLTFPIGAIVVVDVRKEQAAVREANMMNIPVVGLVDTNSDPSLIDYVIPGNDDSVRSVQLIVSHLAEAVAQGQQKCASDKKAREAEAAAAAAELEAARSKEIEQQVNVLAKEVAESEVKKGGKRGAHRSRSTQEIEESAKEEQK